MGYYDEAVLAHHGILGMKWGVRRFQNKDGTLTAKGKKRYETDEDGNYKKVGTSSGSKEASNDDGEKKKGLTDKQKKALVIGAAAVGTAIAAYGGYKLSQTIKTKAAKSIVDKGNSKASDLMKKAGEFRNLAGSAGNLPGQMHRHTLYTSKAVNTENKAAVLLKDTVDKANDIGSSTIKSAKYLYENRPKSSTATVTKIAGQTKFNQAAKANDDLVQSLLKKNAASLAGYSMDDLKKLDLY